MYVTEALKIADDLMFESRGERLNDLERSIVEGVCQGKKYGEIAEESEPKRTEGHVTDTAAKLWQSLSKILGEKISKTNFKAAIERRQSSSANGFVQISGVNLCSDITINNRSEPPLIRKDRNDKSQKYPLEVPELLPFYGRTRELTQLKEWIVNGRSRTILIHGISGSGKTALARQLLEEIYPEFDRIIWQSLGCQRPLTEFLDRNITPSFTRTLEPPLDLEARLTNLLEYLASERCLMILDDVQQILWAGELAGNYALKYREYQQLFERIRDTTHQSCLILLSWEKLREFELLVDEHPAVHSLELGSLGTDGRFIFQSYGLTDEEMWQEVIDYYGGNPHALKIVAAMVKNVFDGRVTDFCETQPLPLMVELKTMWQHHSNRLTTSEQEILHQMATQPLSLKELQASSSISPSDLLDAIQSLGRRGLITKNTSDRTTVFGVKSLAQPLYKEIICRNPQSWIVNKIL